ncbi:MAG: AraC family transcriptional regulator [Planctomycetia bacterium]|nr:AraC family transcriptional regulator [Planctomycetia bacterium]
MTEIHLDLTETTIDGPGTRLWSVRRDDCAELAVHRILHLGMTDAAVPYRRVRLAPSGSFVMVGHEGRGQVLLDGRWQSSSNGVACLAPPRVLNAFHAVPGSRWRFAWIRYDEPEHVRPVVSAASPVRVKCDGDALWRILCGLRTEWEGTKEPRLLHHWIELAHAEARRIAQPWNVEDRLWAVWDEVARDLTADWTLEKLAARYRASKEHFRRVCLRQLGRSPMQHLMSLRIEKAQHLLTSTGDKVESIAEHVGFENTSVFSRAFKRWVGRSPKAYRD